MQNYRGYGDGMDDGQRGEIAARVAQARNQARISRDVLAERAGVAANTVRRIEEGLPVRRGSLAQVVEALGIRAEHGWSLEVEAFIYALGDLLEGLDREKRKQTMTSLMRHLMDLSECDKSDT